MSLNRLLRMSLYLSLMLPPHLMNHFQRVPVNGHLMQLWTLPIAAGMLLAMATWLLGSHGLRRIHPILLTYAILWGGFHNAMTPRLILASNRAFSGDLAGESAAVPTLDDPWFDLKADDAGVWSYGTTSAERLGSYTRGKPMRQDWHSIDALISEAIQPLEDFIFGGQPAFIGSASAIPILFGGLFLVYRRVISLRVPLVIVVTAYLFFYILPVPAAINPQGIFWRPLALPRAHANLATAITFANYELFASPLLFCAFFMATMSGTCPVTKPARMRFAFLAGAAMAVSQVYLSVTFGPILALGAVNLMARGMDEKHGG